MRSDLPTHPFCFRATSGSFHDPLIAVAATGSTRLPTQPIPWNVVTPALVSVIATDVGCVIFVGADATSRWAATTQITTITREVPPQNRKRLKRRFVSR